MAASRRGEWERERVYYWWEDALRGRRGGGGGEEERSVIDDESGGRMRAGVEGVWRIGGFRGSGG